MLDPKDNENTNILSKDYKKTVGVLSEFGRGVSDFIELMKKIKVRTISIEGFDELELDIRHAIRKHIYEKLDESTSYFDGFFSVLSELLNGYRDGCHVEIWKHKQKNIQDGIVRGAMRKAHIIYAHRDQYYSDIMNNSGLEADDLVLKNIKELQDKLLVGFPGCCCHHFYMDLSIIS